MAAGRDLDPLDRRRQRGAWLRGLAVLAVLVGLGIFVWRLANDKSPVKRDAPPMSVVALAPPPPPPPPPPPKEKPPEPEETVSTPAPTPKPEAPQKADAAPKQLTEAGPPQGNDAFGVKAGGGGGLTVGGDPNGSDGVGGDFGADGYARYLTGVLERAAQTDPTLSRDLFTAQLDVWIAPDGGVARVEVVKSSGQHQTDQALIALLHTLRRFDEPPPPQLKFPARIVLHGRKA